MRLPFDKNVTFELLNFDPNDNKIATAIKIIADRISSKCTLASLKSDTIYVFKNDYDSPRYWTTPPFELVSLAKNSSDAGSFIYQLAHELGHLTAQIGLRETNRHNWIEEAICGAYTIDCLRAACARL